MASSNENVSMALFCDFENVALGVRDANYDKFDIKPVLERLLLKGSIVVKKAYCDWDRYKGFKAPMHEANFELIEIPHVRQSGKNSADIRMVVDALDLCYTKSHVDTFVIISGDSDFSPLVSKLRENAKKVIGVGVKQSTSDLLVANCDEFIFYDDLVRESRRAKRESSNEAKPVVKRTPEEERARRDEMEKRRNQAVEIAVNTFEALVLERGDSGKIWASVLKEAIKRRKPDFSESYYGFRTFGNLIEECKARGHLEFGRDEKSGAYVYRGNGAQQQVNDAANAAESTAPVAASTAEGGQQESRRSRNRGRTAAERFAERQNQRLTQQPRAPQESAPTDASEAGVYAEPDHAAVADAAPVALESAGELSVDNAPAKKKNGQKPPARKLKAEAKKAVESAPAKGGRGGRGGKPAAAAEAVAAASTVAAGAAPAPTVSEAVPVAPSPVPAAGDVSATPAKSSRGKPKAKAKAATGEGVQTDAKSNDRAKSDANARADAGDKAGRNANAGRNADADAKANANLGDKAARNASAGKNADRNGDAKPAKPARKPAARTPRAPKAPAPSEE